MFITYSYPREDGQKNTQNSEFFHVYVCPPFDHPLENFYKPPFTN